MGTVNREMAEKIKANNGHYSDDPRVARIVEYTDMGGKQAFGLEYGVTLGRYVASPYVRNPKVFWEAE